jgi:hypothetical protein
MKRIVVVCVLSLAILTLGSSTVLTQPALASSPISPTTYVWTSSPLLPGAAAFISTHDQICLDNYNQCLKGCDGATSCSNQCKVNYDKCLQQNP